MGQLYAKGYNPYTDGLEVHTNMDLGAQKHLYNAANNSVPFQSDQMQAGVAVTDPHNGQIVAMLGGRHIGKTIFGLLPGQVELTGSNLVLLLSQSWTTARQLNTCSTWPTYKSVQDTKYTYPGTNSVLHDFDHQYKGTMTMRDALIQSRNVPAIRTLQTVGISRATEFLKGLGISQKKPYTLQNGIGLYISPLQLSAAYAAFANGGIYYRPYYISSITTQDGTTKTYHKHGQRAMNRATAYMMTFMLKGVINDSQGSGTAARLSGVHQAAKTGTTEFPTSGHSGVMDSWMAGYTKNYSVAVWTGYDHPMAPGGGVSESYTQSAQLLYRSMISYLDNLNHASNWRMPSSVEAVRYRGHRELVIKDSKWALGMIADSEQEESSEGSSSSSSSSSSSGSSSSSSSASSSESSASSSSSSAESSAPASQPSTPTEQSNSGQ